MGAAVSVRKVPSLPSLVKPNVKTLIMGEYNASANEIITMNSKKLIIFIPKNMGIGPTVAMKVPRSIKSYGSLFA